MKAGSKVAVGLAAALGVSAGGVLFIKQKEGTVKRGEYHVAYADPGSNGVPWTACYGSTKGVRKGMVFTDRECDERLAEDILVAERVVQKHVKVPLSQPEYDAYVSFVFNVGETQFRNSTLLRLLNQGMRTSACNQLPRWVYASGKRLPGLVTRRKEEQAMCLQFNKDYVYVPSR
jgi:lysozyme